MLMIRLARMGSNRHFRLSSRHFDCRNPGGKHLEACQTPPTSELTQRGAVARKRPQTIIGDASPTRADRSIPRIEEER